MATSNSLITQTFHGIPGGINQDVPPQEIPNGQARWLQDVLLDNAGEVRKRGPVSAIADVTATLSNKPQGMIQSLQSDGTFRFGILGGTTTPQVSLVESDLATVNSFNFGSNSWSSQPPIYQARPALSGGTMIGAAPQPIPSANANLALWGGGTLADYSTGSITTTQGNQTVTGSGTSFTTHIEPGMFLFKGTSSLTYLGQVASVESNTSLTLRQGAWQSFSGSAYTAKSLRGVSVRNAKGRITVANNQTEVVGAGTKFNWMDDVGDTWAIHRARDMKKLGTISSITDDRNLTLSSGANFAMSNEAFVAVRESPSNNWSFTQSGALDGLGFLTTVYQGRQFYANLPLTTMSKVPEGANMSTRVWWSELFDPEAVDMSSADGDFFHVTSQGTADTPIIAIAGLQNALAILKENELFALYGTDPSTFTLRKIADVGAVSPMSVVQYRNAIIFAGRQGVYSFDGVRVNALTESLGAFWQNGMSGFDATTDRAYGAIFRDHYLLSLTNFASDYSPTKGDQANSITQGTFVLNLITGAWTFFTNVMFKGWANLPASSGFDAWFVVENDSNSHTVVCDAQVLWTSTGKDTVTCKSQTAGPDLYIETKRFDLGDAERKKLLKQVAMHYKLSGDTMNMDTVPGMDETGYTTSIPWQRQTVFTNARIKFLKRDTHIGFRLWETNDAVTDFVFGPFAIAYKLQRVGRQ